MKPRDERSPKSESVNAGMWVQAFILRGSWRLSKKSDLHMVVS